MSIKRNALGKGLSALLEGGPEETPRTNIGSMTSAVGSIANISVDSIEANPFQPRNHFEQEALLELAESIKKQGIIQPLTVRKLGHNEYQLISGERRLRASKIAGLTEVPAYIRAADDQGMLEMAIVENIQRENLNPIEVSISYKRLMEECSLTQEQLSERLGKNRTTVTNYLRLLKLPPEIQVGIRDSKITMGHARAIITIDDVVTQLAIYHEIIDNELSVRQVEALARNNGKKESNKSTANNKPNISPNIKQIQEKLCSLFETKIELKEEKEGKGKIVIPYHNTEDFNRIIEMLGY